MYKTLALSLLLMGSVSAHQPVTYLEENRVNEHPTYIDYPDSQPTYIEENRVNEHPTYLEQEEVERVYVDFRKENYCDCED